ncbi:MAG: pyruvate kinase [Candidatus Dadabacteria bacterium]|nr:MAG: pyruvate kinase [Candidatus Dadabacteria bacterium]
MTGHGCGQQSRTLNGANRYKGKAMLRKTKVVATLGPACADSETLAAMMRAGMNVARLNLSHGDHDSHRKMVELVRETAREVGINVAVMLDTKGIEIRTGEVPDEGVVLEPGQPFRLVAGVSEVQQPGSVGITYEQLAEDVSPGTRILIDDGKIELSVVAADPVNRTVDTTVVIGGRLRSRKGVNIPGISLNLSALSGENRDDLLFAAEVEADYIAASFVRDAQDVIAIRALLEGTGARIPILAKIESHQGVENLEQIVAAADGTMVARGDLGVELPLEDVPHIQKRIIRTTVTNGKPVITATQMLDSMERQPRPTRAEVSDVANAILDGTSAVMLSGETAAGRYPVESVATMSRIAQRAEAHLREYGYLQKVTVESANIATDAVCQAAITMADRLGAAAILTLTESGFTSRTVSKYRPDAPILAVTRSEQVMRKLAMNWGVMALFVAHDDGVPDDEVIHQGLLRARERGWVATGDRVVATLGRANLPGSTNMIKIYQVP